MVEELTPAELAPGGGLIELDGLQLTDEAHRKIAQRILQRITEQVGPFGGLPR